MGRDQGIFPHYQLGPTGGGLRKGHPPGRELVLPTRPDRCCNVTGQVVAKLADDVLASGLHERSWEGTASGVYLYRLMVGERALVGRIVLIR